MLFSSNRTELRRVFVQAWRKRRQGKPLEPLEHAVAGVVEAHPEYHALLEDPDTVDRDFGLAAGETNPYLHLALHVSIHEQVGTDRPPGIRALYAELVRAYGDPHALEHDMMDCLGESLWDAQRQGKPPDEQGYLECLRRLTTGARR